MLAATQKVHELCENDQAQIFIVEGGAGYGKTAYGANIIAESYSLDDGETGNWDISLFKKHMGFHPIKVLETWRHAHGEKVYMWDDSGGWINALDFNHPLIKQIGKQLQTIRTKYHVVIFNALDAEDLARKIRIHKNAINIRITLDGCEPDSEELYRKYRRTATAKHWEKDWYDKGFRIDDWTERFCCYMPNHFYNWYQPIREHYADMLNKLSLKAAKHTKEIVSTVKFAEI